jgi:hypothetical protein
VHGLLRFCDCATVCVSSNSMAISNCRLMAVLDFRVVRVHSLHNVQELQTMCQFVADPCGFCIAHCGRIPLLPLTHEVNEAHVYMSTYETLI